MKLDKKWIDKFRPCGEGVVWLEAQKERDGLRVIKKLRREKQLDWANWTIVTIMTRKQCLAYAIYAAEQVIDIYEKRYPEDKRPRLAIGAAKAVLKRDTKRNRELAAAARAAASAASYVASSASFAASAASFAASDASFAASDAASDAARAAASAAARAAASAASYATSAAASSAASDAARAAMSKKILMFGIELLEKGSHHD